MKERPILFKGEMVRAVLEGRKTQTRRVIKPQYGHEWKETCDKGYWISSNDEGTTIFKRCPYGSPGDRLWVRETWARVWKGDGCPYGGPCSKGPCDGCNIEYRADTGGAPYPGEWPADEVCDETPKWKPSIHMPRWASRIILEVHYVRVERVQEISREDARAEGVLTKEMMEAEDNKTSAFRIVNDPVGLFRSLWDSINAKRGYSWDSNPWVCVVEFKLLEAKCS